METFVHDIQIMIASSLLLLGVIQLMYRNSGPLNRNLAISFFSLGYILLYLGWLTAGERVDLCFLANTETAVTFFSGPAIYLSVTTIVERAPKPSDQARTPLHIPVRAFDLYGNVQRRTVCPNWRGPDSLGLLYHSGSFRAETMVQLARKLLAPCLYHDDYH